MKNILKKLDTFSFVKTLFVFYLMSFGVMCLFALFQFLLEGYIEFTKNDIVEESQQVIFFLTVFLAPLIETLIFQMLVIELIDFTFLKIKFNNNYQVVIAISLSSLAFAFTHFFDIYYLFIAILGGLIYAFLYVYMKKRFNLGQAFFSVVAVHSLTNLTAFILNTIEDTIS